MNYNKIIKNQLANSGFKIENTISKDSFNRVNAILKNSEGKKYFLKAAIGKHTYEFNSLSNEAKLTVHLNNALAKQNIVVNKWRFAVPKVVKFISQDDLVILITEYIDGRKYNLPDLPKKLDIIYSAINMVSKIDFLSKNEIRRLKLKSYSKYNLFILSFFRLLKSIINSKISSALLIKIYLKTLKILFINKVKYSLIHPDLNITNLILKGNTLYITDWEEAGWGISLYNTATPILLYGYGKNKFVDTKKFLANKIKADNLEPLMAYKVFVLFNQKTDTNSDRYKRDLAIINNF